MGGSGIACRGSNSSKNEAQREAHQDGEHEHVDDRDHDALVAERSPSPMRFQPTDLPYLRTVLDYAAHARGPILECGSGLTTLLLALAAPRAAWSLEHMKEWQRHVQTRLWLAGTEANVLLAPLTSYGLFQWYEVPAALPREFHSVVCDGPPGATPGGRYGLLPLLGDRLSKGTVILLDDAQRLDEQRVLQRWEKEAGWRYTIKDSDTGAYAIVTV
jgi:Methyltransferase domain